MKEEDSKQTASEGTDRSVPPTAVTTTGVVLAGGQSRRFGSDDKALAEFEGRPLVERATSAVSEASDRTPVVAVDDETQRERLQSALSTHDPTFVRDVGGRGGPLAGVAASVRAVSTPWLFLAGCDMPMLSPRGIAWLSRYCDADVDGVVLSDEDHPQPLHSFYRRSSVSAALESLGPGAGLRALIDALPDCRSISTTKAPDNVPVQRSIWNVNTREDLETLRSQI